MKPIRCISYNILFGRRLDAIADWTRQQPRAEILCFQEFPKKNIRAFLRASGYAAHNYRFAPALTKADGVYGELTAWHPATCTLKTSRMITMGQSWIERRSKSLKTDRSALLTSFTYRRTPILIVNTQLSALALNRLRYAQITQLLAACTPDSRLVIIGDFNVPTIRTNHTLRRFMKRHGFESLMMRKSTYRIGPIRYQLDYAFTKHCSIRSFTVSRVPFSDHYPVTVEIQP